MALELWQTRLSAHYRELAGRRSKSGWPLFALEHGLDEAALRDLEDDIRDAILTGPPSSKHSLPWIVYASEVGYRYSGDEYWQTFAEETPGWAERGDRRWMRTAFRRFAEELHGAEPEGTWASWFSIIAWPITHAVLPKDLQRQLAQLLYDASTSLRPDVFNTADSLGHHLKTLSRDYSSRFQQFAENVLLLGQVAAALLVQDAESKDSLLLPNTLDRLVRDIEKEQTSREWLSGARSRARRLRLRGLSGRRAIPSSGAAPFPPKWEETPELEGLRFEPQLLARPVSGGAWQLLVEIPSLAPLALRNPAYRDALSKSTGVFVPSGKPIARQALLYGLSPTPLAMWPAPNSPLVQYKGCPPGLTLALEAALRMPPGPRWLFKVQADGQAVHLKSNLVHAGASYLILIAQPVARPAPGLTVASVLCEGVHGLRFDLPETIDDVWAVLMANLGAVPSRTLEVWPVGSPPASWDDEGTAEWLLGQEIMLGVRADHPLDRLIVEFDGHEEHIPLSRSEHPHPVFLALGPVAEGKHALKVRTVPRAAQEQLEGFLDFTVRPPRPWSASQPAYGPLRFLLTPGAPTLEQLWEGRIELNLAAPAWASVKGRVTLLDERANLLFEKTMSPLKAPIEPERWRSAFARDIREDSAAQVQYDMAHLCRVDLDVGQLGRVRLVSERAFTPLRWSARVSSETIVLRLIDNSGMDGVEVREYDFAKPDAFKRHPADVATQGLRVDSDGGLYYASVGEAEAAIVATRGVLRAFSDLRVEPRLSGTTSDYTTLESLLGLARVWGEAKVSGSALSAFYRRNVLQAIARKAASSIGGASWEEAERVHRRTKEVEQLKRAVASAPHQRALGTALLLDVSEYARLPIRDRIGRLTDLSAKFVAHPRTTQSTAAGVEPLWIWELGLRVASRPDTAREWASGRFEAGIRTLLDNPVVMRASRFLVLIVDRELGADPEVGAAALYNGWTW